METGRRNVGINKLRRVNYSKLNIQVFILKAPKTPLYHVLVNTHIIVSTWLEEVRGSQWWL